VTDAPLVLVADDDEDIRHLVTLRLERAGCRVVAAADGDEALALAVAHEPDLAVLDVMMPGMTGLEVTERIRSSEDGARMPILLLTARVQDADVEHGLAMGADGYVKKPFSGPELVERVRELLGLAA
jgi:DNA-binding response OmpR family regulator